MIIAYGSDLHIEFGTKGLVDQLKELDADILILAGDVATADDYTNMHKPDTSQTRKDLKAFFDLAHTKFKETLVIMGNHEYYGSEISRTPRKIREALEPYPNITLLENETKTIDDVVFFGATMWTDMAAGRPLEEWQIRQRMNDFRRIRYNDNGNYRKFTPSDARGLHTQSIDALAKSLGSHPDQKFVSIHHHAPSSRSVDSIYKNSIINGAYYSPKLEYILESKIWPKLPDLIIHGHMHNVSTYNIGTVHVLANPRGYQGHEARADRFRFEVEVI